MNLPKLQSITKKLCVALLGGFLLAVLLDGDDLLVDLLVEGTADGPVVGDGDTLPSGIVIVRSLGTVRRTALESPAAQQQLLAVLSMARQCHAKGEDQEYDFFHGFHNIVKDFFVFIRPQRYTFPTISARKGDFIPPRMKFMHHVFGQSLCPSCFMLYICSQQQILLLHSSIILYKIR